MHFGIIGSKNRRGIWHTRNEAVDGSGKGNLPVFLYLQVVMTCCSLQAVAGNITSAHSCAHRIQESHGRLAHTQRSCEWKWEGKLASFPVLSGCHEQVVLYGRLQVTSLQRARSMWSGTHATKLWIEVGRETGKLASFPVLAGCHEQAVLFRRLQLTSLQRTSAYSLHVHIRIIGSNNRMGVWRTCNEAVDRSGNNWDRPLRVQSIIHPPQKRPTAISGHMKSS